MQLQHSKKKTKTKKDNLKKKKILNEVKQQAEQFFSSYDWHLTSRKEVAKNLFYKSSSEMQSNLTINILRIYYTYSQDHSFRTKK